MPTVSFCACAAIGALMAPAIAAMASILFRILNSFAMMHAGLDNRHAIVPMHRPSHRSRQMPPHTRQFSAFFVSGRNRLKRRASAIVEPHMRIKCSSRFDIPHSAIAENFQMTLTVAHISPIMSVIAGVLILIMPRLLNLVVAIFLILNGLIGLGLLKWLHL
jgi:hypothetical protein